VLKDDLPFLDEQLMECDALILASPVFVLGPHGLIKVLNDRLGPSHDVGFRMEAKRIRDAQSITAGEGPDERSFKKRVGAFIAVAGSATPVAAPFALPLMNLFTWPLRITAVDQMQVLGAGRLGDAALMPDALARAGRLGKNVVMAMKVPPHEVPWLGDEPGTCPSCHSNLLIVKDRNPVSCPICGIKGELRVEDGKISVVFSEEQLNRSRLVAVDRVHWTKIEENIRKGPDKSRMSQNRKKYEGYGEIEVKNRFS
jgi:hypothetical protein